MDKPYIAKITFENFDGSEKIIMEAYKDENGVGVQAYSSKEVQEKNPDTLELEGKDGFIGLANAFLTNLGGQGAS